MRIISPDAGRPDPRHPRLPRPDGPAQPHLPPDSVAGPGGARGSSTATRLPGRRGRWTSVVASRAPCATSRSALFGTARPHRPRRRRRRRHRRRRPGRPRRGRLRIVRGLTTVVLEAEAIGGQAGTTSMIRNYLGFPRGISGMRLAQRARNQAIRFGTQFFTRLARDRHLEARRGRRPRTSCTPTAATSGPGAVVISTGVTYRKLRVPGPSRRSSVWASTTAAPMTAAREMEGARGRGRRRRQLGGAGRDPPRPLRRAR